MANCTEATKIGVAGSPSSRHTAGPSAATQAGFALSRALTESYAGPGEAAILRRPGEVAEWLKAAPC